LNRNYHCAEIQLPPKLLRDHRDLRASFSSSFRATNRFSEASHTSRMCSGQDHHQAIVERDVLR
jgi:hypothetical protein